MSFGVALNLAAHVAVVLGLRLTVAVEVSGLVVTPVKVE
jgi:hypothetical protein